MKRFLLLFVVLSLGLTSCRRIVTSDSEIIDKGQIVQIDKGEQNGALPAKTNYIAIDSKFYNEVVKYTVNEWDYFSYRRFSVGDNIYLYNRGGQVVASTLSVKEAKSINSYLSDKWYDDIFGWTGFWVFIFIPIFLIVLWYFVMAEGMSETIVVTMVMLTLICIVVSPVAFNFGARLEYMDEGYVASVNQDKVILDNNAIFYLDDIRDISSKTEVVENNYVYIYKYEGEPSMAEYYASLDKLDSNTYNRKQIYPEKVLGTIVLWIISFVIWFLIFRLFIKTWRKRKERS